MLELSRRQDWPERLFECTEAHRTAAFAWGAFDCATYFADAVIAVTGVDPLLRFRGWTSERSARMRLIKAGFKNMQEFAAEHFEPIHPSMARRGDIGFAPRANSLSCPAVVTGAEAMSRNEKGWIILPATALTSAFRVG